MKKHLRSIGALALVAALAMFPALASAQTVTAQPQFVAPRTVLDLGNGPVEMRVLTGNAGIFTAQGSGVGSGTTTAVTLTATPAIAPCVGCILSGVGVTSGTLITAYNGTTGITTNTSQTIGASTALSWGAACPVSTQTAPTSVTAAMALVQAGIGGDIPFYTQARVCAYGATGPGAQFLTFAIGAH